MWTSYNVVDDGLSTTNYASQLVQSLVKNKQKKAMEHMLMLLCDNVNKVEYTRRHLERFLKYSDSLIIHVSCLFHE